MLMFPPHARGWTLCPASTRNCSTVSPARAGMDPCARLAGRRSLGFPARAGMDPCGVLHYISIWGFPRTRGDGPLRSVQARGVRRFPPHARGWTRLDLLQGPEARVSPARAGMDPSTSPRTRSRSRFPRTRGDGPRTGSSSVRDTAFPPHARGWTRSGLGACARLTVSPARAGMDRHRSNRHRRLHRFPRTRGDGPVPGHVIVYEVGFPRTRGDGPPADSHIPIQTQFPPHARDGP